jgi:c-di-GMP-binding flagellar brake protein YcgR
MRRSLPSWPVAAMKDWLRGQTKADHVEHTEADASTQERKFARVGDTLLVSYSIGEEFAPEFTETYDIALGGMAMLTNAEMQRDEPISVQLELRGDAQPILRLRGVIRWSRYDPLMQRYRTGVAFLDVDDATRSNLQRYIDTLHLLRDMGML